MPAILLVVVVVVLGNNGEEGEEGEGLGEGMITGEYDTLGVVDFGFVCAFI